MGSILSAGVTAIVAGLPVWSTLTERMGKLGALFVSLFIFIVATVSFGFCGTLMSWRVTRAIQGVGVSGISVASTRIVLSYSEELEKNFGYMETVTGALASVSVILLLYPNNKILTFLRFDFHSLNSRIMHVFKMFVCFENAMLCLMSCALVCDDFSQAHII